MDEGTTEKVEEPQEEEMDDADDLVMFVLLILTCALHVNNMQGGTGGFQVYLPLPAMPMLKPHNAARLILFRLLSEQLAMMD